MHRVLIVDNNCMNRLSSREAQRRLKANLRATWRTFWPTAVNVLEAMQTGDCNDRVRFLDTIADLAGENFAFTLPGEALRRIAVSLSRAEAMVDWSEPRVTQFFRDPSTATDDQIRLAREHLQARAASFADAHERAREVLRPVFKDLGGHRRWASSVEFIEKVWLRPSHLQDYVNAFWNHWSLADPPSVDVLLENMAWRLFFESWGASVYAEQIQHPQAGHVGHADLEQLVYLGVGAETVLFATEDKAFAELARA